MLKNFLKKYLYSFLLRDKLSSSVQVRQVKLLHYYRDCVASGKVPPLKDTGYKVFSQFEEDGLLFFIFAVIGEGKKLFVEIGSNDGVNSNCSNLAIHFGWHGLFIDADRTAIERGKHFYKKHPDPWSYKPKFACTRVTRENINDIIRQNGFEGEVDLLSIDLDGNDYWIWDALEVIRPRAVIIETHVEFGYNNIVVPYDADYSFPGKHPVYHGASPVAMNNLAKKKGYRLVGANAYGFNTIYIRNGLANSLIPEVSVESILQHPSAKESFKLFEEVKNWEYVKG